jgi:hypothetical protein
VFIFLIVCVTFSYIFVFTEQHKNNITNSDKIV